MRIEVKVNGLKSLIDRMKLSEKNIRFAAKKALDATAKKVVEEETKQIKAVFDRPTPKTETAVKVFKKARTDDLETVVGIYDGLHYNNTAQNAAIGSKGKGAIPPAKYLLAQIAGGVRAQKRFELALQRANLMPPGMAAVFAKRSNALDQYGNITQGKIVQILSYFAAFPEQGYKANMSDKRKQNMMKGRLKGLKWGMVYFRGGRNTGLPDGVWERHYPNGTDGKSFIRPILIYVKSANYKIRFPFHDIAKRVVNETWKTEIDKALQQELAWYAKR